MVRITSSSIGTFALSVGVVGGGDEHQPRPVFTGSQGATQFNEYRRRLEVSLPSRLVEEGFPTGELIIQRRSHPALTQFLKSRIYPRLEDHPSTDGPLEVTLAGMRMVIAKALGIEKLNLDQIEEMLRAAVIKIESIQQCIKSSTIPCPACILEHAYWFVYGGPLEYNTLAPMPMRT